jgi:hypothetical protein
VSSSHVRPDIALPPINLFKTIDQNWPIFMTFLCPSYTNLMVKTIKWLGEAERFGLGSEVTMSGFQEVIDNPVKIMMLLLCILGAGFMLWFLVGLIADQRREQARYVIRFQLGEDRPVEALKDRVDDESFLDEARLSKLQPDRTSHFPVQGVRM